MNNTNLLTASRRLHHLSDQAIVDAMSAIGLQMDAIIGEYVKSDKIEFVFFDDTLNGDIPLWNVLETVYSLYESELSSRGIMPEKAIDEMGLHVYQR